MCFTFYGQYTEVRSYNSILEVTSALSRAESRRINNTLVLKMSLSLCTAGCSITSNTRFFVLKRIYGSICFVNTPAVQTNVHTQLFAACSRVAVDGDPSAALSALKKVTRRHFFSYSQFHSRMDALQKRPMRSLPWGKGSPPQATPQVQQREHKCGARLFSQSVGCSVFQRSSIYSKKALLSDFGCAKRLDMISAVSQQRNLAG